MKETITELKKEIEDNIKVCIRGIKRNDKNLDYHIGCLMNEVEKKSFQKVCQEMKKVFKREIELQTVGTDTIDKIEELLKKFQ